MTFETCNAMIERILCLILELAYLRWVEAKAGRLTFTVKPHLLRGLVLDPYTGWVTGFPEVQGSGTFEVSVANTLGMLSGASARLSTPRRRVAFSLCSPSASSSPDSRRLSTRLSSASADDVTLLIGCRGGILPVFARHCRRSLGSRSAHASL